MFKTGNVFQLDEKRPRTEHPVASSHSKMLERGFSSIMGKEVPRISIERINILNPLENEEVFGGLGTSDTEQN